MAWTQLFRSFGMDTGNEGMYLTGNLFQLPLPRNNRVDSGPPASNLICLLKIDTTFGEACGSYFNVARFEKNNSSVKCVLKVWLHM